MSAIVDKRIHPTALERLSGYDKTFLFETEGITYDAIACHPDIFFCAGGDSLIVAPNCPSGFRITLKEHGIVFREGKMPVGKLYPETACYNALVTDKYLIHNTDVTDSAVLTASGSRVRIHVKQAYTRCNLIHIGKDYFITSDRGIEKALREKNLNVLFIHPEPISLPGFSHGFFGGCCGLKGDKLFIHGGLHHIPEAETVRAYIHRAGAEVIELHDGPLSDIGSIVFV